MRKVFSHSIIKIVAILSLTPLVQATQFHLPPGTPGLQQALVQQNVNGNLVNCEHVIVPGTTCHLYFPIDGSQPTTAEAGQYSGARYNNPDNNRITDWWVRVFGGNMAVNQIHNGMYDRLIAPRMVFKINNHNSHIIRVDTRNIPAGFEQQFWQTFRQIAADPVGRVLLYRLLIEIRRLDNAGINGCCGDEVVLPRRYNLTNRNNCRRIEIRYSDDGCCFYGRRHRIEFDTDVTIQTSILKLDAGKVTTEEDNRNYDIALFHEMLHWLHYLRNPHRFNESDSDDPLVFKYPLRFYYGNVNELSVWGGDVDAEEIATILGVSDLTLREVAYLNLIPNNAFLSARTQRTDITIRFHNGNQYIPNSEKFLNGDDLSENLYRASRSRNGNLHYMRFGHVTTAIEPVSYPVLPNRFQLANQVVLECYEQITRNDVQGWRLIQNQAIK